MFDVQPVPSYSVQIEPGLVYGETDVQLVLSCGPFRGRPTGEADLDSIVLWDVRIKIDRK